MTTKVGTVLLIEPEEPRRCELCDNRAELRPYGPGGKSICVDCADRDPEGTQKRMNVFLERMLKGTTHVVSPNGEILKTRSLLSPARGLAKGRR